MEHNKGNREGEEARRLLQLLEERLVQHDDNRKEVQERLQSICSKVTEEANSFEEKTSGVICKAFDEAEERILGLIEELNIIAGEQTNDGDSGESKKGREYLGDIHGKGSGRTVKGLEVPSQIL